MNSLFNSSPSGVEYWKKKMFFLSFSGVIHSRSLQKSKWLPVQVDLFLVVLGSTILCRRKGMHYAIWVTDLLIAVCLRWDRCDSESWAMQKPWVRADTQQPGDDSQVQQEVSLTVQIEDGLHKMNEVRVFHIYTYLFLSQYLNRCFHFSCLWATSLPYILRLFLISVDITCLQAKLQDTN